MYGRYGLSLNIENIYTLAAPYITANEKIITMADLKPAYVRFLNNLHPDFPIQTGDILIRDRARMKAFGDAFSASVLDDLQQERMVGGLYDQDFFEANARLLQQAITQLHNLKPELGELFDLAVHAIILCNSDRNQEGFRAHGGTTNKCIGLIWLNIKPDLSLENVLEMLIHELTHTLVFLDEVNREHFNYEVLGKERFWALSSILKRRRPMDKVIHSVLVSMEILYARRNYLPPTDESKLIHPDSNALAANIRASIDSVLNHPYLTQVCTERTIELMQGAQDAIAL
jgi:hypothetical protein